MRPKTLEKICDPHISILQNISMLRENWLKHKDLDNAILYLHPGTYDRLLAENSGAIYYMNFGATKIMGIKIKIDPRVRPYHLLIREEDNMEREYCKNDVDTLDAYRYAFFGGRGAGKSNKVLTPLPTKYVINEGATILFWSDGTKTIVKRAEDDEYNKVMGFLWAYFQKHSGLSKTKANEYLRSLTDDKDLKVIEMLEKGELRTTLGNVAEGISNAFKNMADNLKKNKED